MELLSYQGNKGTKEFRAETTFILRHKDVLRCPIQSIALYLFVIFDQLRFPLPPFHESNGASGALIEREWYHYYLFPGEKKGSKRGIGQVVVDEDSENDDDGDDDDGGAEDDGAEDERKKEIVAQSGLSSKIDFKDPIHDSTHRASIAKVFQACNITKSKVTHSFRASAAIDAAENNAPEESIMDHGQWSKGKVYRRCYQTAPDLATPVALADFDANRAAYVIERGALPVPESLQKRIFPFIQEERAQYEARLKSNPLDVDESFLGFLSLLEWMREIILQDSLWLKPRFPSCFIWTSDVFSSVEYHQWAVSMTSSMEASMTLVRECPNVSDPAMNRAVLHIAHNMANIQLMIRDNLNAVNSAKMPAPTVLVPNLHRSKRGTAPTLIPEVPSELSEARSQVPVEEAAVAPAPNANAVSDISAPPAVQFRPVWLAPQPIPPVAAVTSSSTNIGHFIRFEGFRVFVDGSKKASHPSTDHVNAIERYRSEGRGKYGDLDWQIYNGTVDFVLHYH